jgi:hypothetical protein
VPTQNVLSALIDGNRLRGQGLTCWEKRDEKTAREINKKKDM